MLTEEQKKERLKGIGGSDAPAVAGVSKYKTPLDIYLIKTGQSEDNSTMEAAYWGNKLEKDVANEYASKMGVDIYKPEGAVVHPEYYWMRCNLDFVVRGSTIVGECKTAGFASDEWGEEGTDEMPGEYIIQCAHNAIASEHLFRTTQVDVPVLFGGYGGHRHRIYTYRRNKNLESKIIEMGRAFWQEHVERMIPPMPSTTKESLMLWPNASEEIKKVADPDILSKIDSLRIIKNQIKILQEQEEAEKAALCNYMKDASILLDSNGSSLATWKNQEANRLDMERFKKDQQELYKEYLKKSKTRILRISQ